MTYALDLDNNSIRDAIKDSGRKVSRYVDKFPLAASPNIISVNKLDDLYNIPNFDLHKNCQDLISMESRFRFYGFIGDIEDNKGYFISNRFIYMNYSLPNIEHEIAHMVEMSNLSRITKDDWGMPLNTDDDKTVSMAAIVRELRVRIIQHIITETYKPIRKISDAWNRNSFWSEYFLNKVPFGRFHSKEIAEQWVIDMAQKTRTSLEYGPNSSRMDYSFGYYQRIYGNKF